MRTPNAPLTTAMTSAALLLMAALFGHLNFARWDNSETFLPAIWYSHNELLAGRFALWNPYQNLGEPIHAHGNGGALYLPYTLVVLITKLLQWPEAAALDLSALLHIAFGTFGFTALARELGVRRSISMVAGLSVMLSGYALFVGGMWVHVIPNLAWTGWAMWGLRRVLFEAQWRAGMVVAALALGIVFHTGHVQSAVNVWLGTGAWCAALLMAVPATRARPRMLTLGLIFLAGALVALPALLPTALIALDSSRTLDLLPPSRGFRWEAVVLAAITPVVGGTDGTLVHTIMATTFIGAWVLPALLMGGLSARRVAGDEQLMVRVLLATVLAGLLFVWLQFGVAGKLYPLLHSLPIFSKFRMAFKYYERAVPLLVLAGALALELAARRPVRGARVIPFVLLIIGAAAWLVQPTAEPQAFIAGLAALAVLLVLGLQRWRWLVPLSALQCFGLIWIAHNASTRSKPYLLDRQPEARLPIASPYRVLPLSIGPPDHPYTRPLSLFFAATLDGYESASGHRFALTSKRLTQTLFADVAGVPGNPATPVQSILRSNWLHMANVGHLVVDRADSARLADVRAVFPAARARTTRFATLFDIEPKLPRAWFASEQLPGNDAGTYEALFTDVPVTAAAVDGDERRRALPPARVTALDWGKQRIRVTVDAPQGGLLVLSLSYSKEWLARAAGERQALVPVNGMFTGIWLPAGARTIDLRVRRWPLLLGLSGAAIGIAAIVLAAAVHSRRRWPCS